MRDDLRLAWKRLRSAPGFAAGAVVTLAIAVGATTAIFLVADAVLFRPLPYAQPERLFVVRSIDPKTGVRSSGLPYEYVAAIQRQHSGVAAVALRSTTLMMSHAAAEGGEYIEMFAAAPDYFRILGVRPFRGRLFEAGDVAEGDNRVMLTYESWRTRFGADETIVGRAVRLGTDDRLVVGILPPRFIFPSMSLWHSDDMTGRAEFATTGQPPDPAEPTKRSPITLGGQAMDAVVRLKPGVTLERAQAELDVLVASAPPRRPEAVRRIVLEDLRSLLFPTGRGVLLLLLAAAGLVLLVGCANLGNLLLARTRRRRREIAVQMAIGAGRVRLVRPILFETLLIASAATVLATAATALVSDVLIREVPRVVYGRAFAGFDFRVAAFAWLVGISAGLMFAVAPAWSATRMDVQALIRKGPGRGHRSRRRIVPMIAAQVALAIALVAGALTAARAFVAVLNEPLGFDPDNVAALRVQPRLDGPATRDFLMRVVEALGQHPDVVAIGIGSSRPFDRIGGADRAGEGTDLFPVAHVLPGYWEALGMRLRQGRFPDSGSSATGLEPVVMTRSAAQVLFQGRSPIGDTVTIRKRLAEVVGVVDDVMTDFDDPRPWIYLVPHDFLQLSTIVVKTRARRAEILADLRRRVVAMTPPSEPVTAKWLEESIGSHAGYRNPRFQAVVLGTFGVLALGLAALGTAAIVAAVVASRNREMGVRIATGASPRSLVRLVVAETFASIVVGLGGGIAATLLLERLAAARIADLEAISIDAIGVAVLLVLGAGLMAAYLPARRAGRVDPIVVLRAE
jgi:predicted permease